MVQEINLIVTVLGESSLESQIATQSILDELKLNDSNKIFCKDSINLLSSCENCANTVQLNVYWNGERKFYVSGSQTQIKHDQEVTSDIDMLWEEPCVLIKEEPEEQFSQIKSEPSVETNFVSYSGANDPPLSDLESPPKDNKKLRAHKSRHSSHDKSNEAVQRSRTKRVKKSVDKVKNSAIDDYLSCLSLPEGVVLPNLYTLNAQHSRLHPQPDGSSIYVGKGTNHLQVMNFDPRREKCDLCGKSQLKNKPDLIAHRFKDHFFPDDRDECQGCHKEFRTSDAKMAHSHFCDQKHQIKVNYCKKCNEQFPAYPKYVSHMKKVHNGDGIDLKYMCHLCSSTFERPTQLELHVLKHRDPKPYKCAHCDAEFKGRHGLETHLIRIHFPQEAKYICNACQIPALFGSNEQYKTHLHVVHFTNSKEKQECPYCKKLIRKLGLAHHIRQQHTNTGHKEKFECPSCNKIFFNKKGLEIHSVIHLPEDQRHFRCRFCGRSFNFKQHLVAHERSHTGEKPFKCETCGKAFARKQALTDHQREHTGQGYACSVCGRMFTDRGNYRHHMKQHESQMGVKLTFNHEERRLMRLKVLTAEQALKGGLNDDF